ncbi:predicted protein [Aspergillus nidulans FGSC A4]|uniref:Uncharacterized protein n=1 Tax=Emericella nidulans (strain FGSC A4 / ATCC 38163 / CBS 112.46 / NRRL 194 / M139) TaxID=227321 RepID=Q5B5P8_EMENI|nr:hypothetical protein [Aspergillus nidulans FGSC A4]EAA59393.1 predicted protein [Aspergillus nidulans FGSC A4]CBF74634.1 TPA: conserved hypothetical protein [Aspergillus nidulans FGSC A4]|eukprot:XP_661736.1 predicted protein [Aspergillus nidulans FGSC A4]
MVKAELIRRTNKKLDNRVADVLPNIQTPTECTAQVEYRFAAKRQRKADTHKFSDAQMPVRCAAHQASEIQGGISELGYQRDSPENTEGGNCSHIEHYGSCGNGCDGDAGNTKLTTKPHKKVSWNLTGNISAPLQSSVAPLLPAQHLQSAAVPDTLPQQDLSTSSKPLSALEMAESAIFVQKTNFVALGDTPIGCHEQPQTDTSRLSVTSSGSRSQEEFVTPTVSENTLKEHHERIQELPTVFPAQQDADLGEGKINDMEDLASTDADPNARIQELEDCVVAQALKLVSQAKEIKSLVETVNELRGTIQSSSGKGYRPCKRSKEYTDEKIFEPQKDENRDPRLI